MTRGADPPSNAPSPGSPDTAAESSPSAASPASQVASRAPRLALLIATGFGLGYLPKAPGTWGSLAGIGLFYAMFVYPLDLFFEPHTESTVIAPFMPMVVTALVGVWAAGRIAKSTRLQDPSIVVIDEISGQLITMYPITLLHWHPDMHFFWEPEYQPGWQYLLAGFILFRVFDIWKPWPVRAAEKLPGGWGIMADDWVAGIYAALCLWLLRAAGM